MMRSAMLTVGVMSVLGVGFVSWSTLDAGTKPADIIEEQVSANLVRVRIHGNWEEFPLMPLADHLCKSPDRQFERYCGDDVSAPN